MNFFLFALQLSGTTLLGALKKQIAHEFEVFATNFARLKDEPALLGEVGAKCPGEPLSPLVAYLVVEVTSLRARIAFLEGAAGISYEKDAEPATGTSAPEEGPEDVGSELDELVFDANGDRRPCEVCGEPATRIAGGDEMLPVCDVCIEFGEDPEDHVPCRDCGRVSCTCVVFSDEADDAADDEANHV